MKRVGYLYSKIIDKNNIINAIIRSSKGKTKRKDVIKVIDNIEFYSDKIYDLLSNKKYVPSKYNTVIIFDKNNKKERTISKPRYYPDQIIHYCLMNVLEPILLRKMYLYSCGNIPKRGTSFAQKSIRKWLDSDIKGTKYCLKMDIKKFYPSVNKEILKDKFERVIKDKECLWLINSIIDSDCVGIPLGNYTSSCFSNFFLNELDFFIKEKLKVQYYIRYVDDLVILSPNKKKLHKVLNDIKEFLNAEKLTLKNNYQIFNIYDRDIDFLGYRFFREKTILRRRNMYKISRKAKKIYNKQKTTFKDACGIISYYGWIKHSDSYNFYHSRVRPYANINKMKKVVSDYSKSLLYKP